MEIFLVFLLLTKSVLGDKLSHGYLPPPDAHLSAGDLNYNDLPFELPVHALYTDENTAPEVKEMGNYFINSQGVEAPVSYDTYYKAPEMKFFSEMTTISPITDFFNTPSTQLTTVTDFTYDTTEYKIPQDINQSQGPEVLFLKVVEDVEEAMPVSGIEDKYFSDSSMSNRKPNSTLENQISYINYPNTNSDKNVDLFDNQQKYNNYSPHQNDFSLTSTRRIQFQNNDRNAINTNQKYNRTSNGFSYSFETSNGMRTDVSGIDKDGLKSKGSYSYTGDDGKVYKMEYTADENGFQPKGAHLPTPPPIPKEIQAVIEQAYKNKAAGIFDDGSYSDDKYGYKNYMPRYKNKVTKQNNGNKFTKKTIIQASNTNGDYYSRNVYKSDLNDIKPMNNKMIPVEVIYDKGYNYSRPENKLHLPGIHHPTDYISSEATKSQINDIKTIQNVKKEGENRNLQNNDTITDTEKQILLEPADEISISEKKRLLAPNSGDFYESENYKTILPTTYGMSFNNFNNQGFPTSTIPFNSLKNTNSRDPEISKYIHEDEDMILTVNPEAVTTASPSTVSLPIYVKTQVGGEDFSGPKQLPTFNPKFGYYY